jgi:hypothetical protein
VERVPSLSPSSPGYLIAWVLGVEVGVRKGEATFLSFFFLGMEARRCMIVGRAVSGTFIFVHFFFKAKYRHIWN